MRLPLLLLAALLLTAAAPQPEPLIAPEALRADLRVALDTIDRIHPQLAHSVDREALAAAAEAVGRELDRPMTATEAWRRLAKLNPLFADAHLMIGLPDWRDDTAETVEAGVGLFPFEVAVGEDGSVSVTAALGGAPTPLAGRRLLRINGRDAGAVAREMLARMHGDTPRFRAALLAQRWWLYHWKLFGTPARFDLEFDGGERQQIAASASLPALLRREADFDRSYRCDLRPGRSALLDVAAFSWPDKPRFFAFAHDCFARLKAAGTRHLVIDIRQNGGGDDDMWKEGILRYLADRPYRHGSTGTKRVLEPYRDEGEVVGQVVEARIETATEPPADEPLRFRGGVTLLIGPLTYSSAVLFANTVQDHRFAKLAGVGGAVRSRQSGGVQALRLPASGLTLSVPRFVLDRPSGRPGLLQPDRPLADDPLDPDAMVRRALEQRPRR